MSLVMTDLGEQLGISHPMLTGIAVGVLGIIAVAMAYPVYNLTLKHWRKRIASEILRLTEEYNT